VEPLRIECRLATPWFPPAFGLHLDGLLAWSLVNDTKSAGVELIDYQAIISDLPLERHLLASQAGHGDAVWCASQFVPVGWLGQERRYLTAKTSGEDMAHWIGRHVVDTKGGSTIDTVRGIAKNAQAYYTVEHVRGLRAWCIGDLDAITDLLSRVRAVGVKTRIGLGTLLPYRDGSLWEVRPDEQASQFWRRRSSPERLIDDSFRAIGSWRSPYWKGTEPIWRPMPMRIADEVASLP
jgi:CRISPR type IV-associated protein Csf3